MSDLREIESKKAKAMFETWATEQVGLGKFQDETVVVYRSIWQA